MHNIKYLFLYLVLLIAPNTAIFCQAPASMVYDVRNDINQTNQYLLSLKNLGEATSQSASLKEIWDFYKRTEQMLSKVNSALNNILYLQNIIQSQLNTIRWYGYYLDQSRTMKHVDLNTLSTFNSNLASLLKQSEQNLKLAENLIKDSFFKMNDAERLKALKEVQSDIDANYTMMEIAYNRLYMKNSDAQIKETLKNW